MKSRKKLYSLGRRVYGLGLGILGTVGLAFRASGRGII